MMIMVFDSDTESQSYKVDRSTVTTVNKVYYVCTCRPVKKYQNNDKDTCTSD